MRGLCRERGGKRRAAVNAVVPQTRVLCECSAGKHVPKHLGRVSQRIEGAAGTTIAGVRMNHDQERLEQALQELQAELDDLQNVDPQLRQRLENTLAELQSALAQAPRAGSA